MNIRHKVVLPGHIRRAASMCREIPQEQEWAPRVCAELYIRQQ